VKVDGNEADPNSLGAADLITQGLILEMYDPDRSTGVVRRGRDGVAQRSSWGEFTSWWGENVLEPQRAAQGAGIAVVSEATSSPTVERLRAQFLDMFPKALWCTWEPLAASGPAEAAEAVFGQDVRTHLNLRGAKVIASFDDDFLMANPAALRLTREFADGRRIRTPEDAKEMNRLWVVEPNYSVTGSNADHRYRMRAGDVGKALAAVAHALSRNGVAVAEAALAAVPAPSGAEYDFAKTLAKDLAAHQGKALVTVGDRQPAYVHALAHAVNAALGATSAGLVAYTPRKQAGNATLKMVADAVRSGAATTLVVIGANPAYTGPVDEDFASVIERAGNSIHLGLFEDETGSRCLWHLNRAHALESWGDTRNPDGTVLLQQPVILPLYGGKTAAQFIAALMGNGEAQAQALVRETHAARFPEADAERAWRRSLHAGAIEGSADYRTVTPKADFAKVAELAAKAPAAPASGEVEVVFAQDAKLFDGRFANNGWLQELPDPMTKVTWDNAALLDSVAAERLGVKTGSMVNVEVNGRTLAMAAYVMPGIAQGTVVLNLGYGRTAAGRVGNAVGFNTYRLRTSAQPWIAAGKVTRASGSYKLALTQDHHVIDSVGFKEREKRIPQMVREQTAADHQAHPDHARHVVHATPPVNLWKPHEYTGYKWGMAIDLNACTGCNACVVACNAENNVPIVGKEQVWRGREMHWIRIDRYYRGAVENPQAVHMPLTCVHCENAPCEQVCPVAATVHDDEGINVMVYNRCIGTRYCSNNCPYKVRRFNFFSYTGDLTETEKMRQNPEVTVRMRGVMEKCTYCYQRIAKAKITAKNEGRKVRDGEIRTACQVTCPAQAIVFGDLADRESQVSKLHAQARSYETLEFLHLRQRTLFLAKVRNPHPDLAPAGHDGGHSHNTGAHHS
jgi:molybdopterin-containing oxidoreductase family iron-sulfur binding subunit